jgi:hypothetical protein
MKYILLWICLGCAHFAGAQNVQVLPDPSDPRESLPQPQGWVNDFEQVLDSLMEKTLAKLIDAHEDKTTNQIAVISGFGDLRVGNFPTLGSWYEREK